MEKYRHLELLIRQRLGGGEIESAPEIGLSALYASHDPGYVDAVCAGALPRAAQRQIGFPWSPEMVARSRRSTGATWAACLSALSTGRGVNLAGGTHHAHYARGGGYCVFNDSVVAFRTLQAEGRIRRAMVIDLDVHQGDGTASMAAGDPSIYTLSFHGAKNYPFRKESSDLDLAFPDGTGDLVYLSALRAELPRAIDVAAPELVVYLSGADPYQGDLLGRLSLSVAGLAARDRIVFEACDQRGIPVAVTMGGGYAASIEQIARIHRNTVLLAAGEAPIIEEPAEGTVQQRGGKK